MQTRAIGHVSSSRPSRRGQLKESHAIRPCSLERHTRKAQRAGVWPALTGRAKHRPPVPLASPCFKGGLRYRNLLIRKRHLQCGEIDAAGSAAAMRYWCAQAYFT